MIARSCSAVGSTVDDGGTVVSGGRAASTCEPRAYTPTSAAATTPRLTASRPRRRRGRRGGSAISSTAAGSGSMSPSLPGTVAVDPSASAAIPDDRRRCERGLRAGSHRAEPCDELLGGEQAVALGEQLPDLVPVGGAVVAQHHRDETRPPAGRERATRGHER